MNCKGSEFERGRDHSPGWLGYESRSDAGLVTTNDIRVLRHPFSVVALLCYSAKMVVTPTEMFCCKNRIEICGSEPFLGFYYWAITALRFRFFLMYRHSCNLLEYIWIAAVKQCFWRNIVAVCLQKFTEDDACTLNLVLSTYPFPLRPSLRKREALGKKLVHLIFCQN